MCGAFLKGGNMNSNKVLEKPIQVAYSVVSVLLISRSLTSYIYGVCGQTVGQRADWNC